MDAKVILSEVITNKVDVENLGIFQTFDNDADNIKLVKDLFGGDSNITLGHIEPNSDYIYSYIECLVADVDIIVNTGKCKVYLTIME